MSEATIQYNLDYLHQIAGGDENFVREMVETFVNTGEGTIEELQRHLTEGKNDKLKETAHRFITTLTYIGVKDLDEPMRFIEEWAQAGNHKERIAAMLDIISKRCHNVIGQLKIDFKL